MKCSTSIGTLDPNRELYKNIKGEQFYLTQLHLDGIEIPAVGSEYIIGTLRGRIKFQYYLRSETIDEKKLFTFIQIITAESVDNEPESNCIQVGGYVAKTKGLLIKNSSGLEILPFIIKYRSYDGNFNIAHCVAKGAQARELSNIKKGDILEITGQFKKAHNTIEVLVQEINDYKTLNVV